MLFGTRPDSSPLPNWSIQFLHRTPLVKVEEFKYLELWFGFQLSFNPHIDSINMDNNFAPENTLLLSCFTLQFRKRIIMQLIFPILDYAYIIYVNTTKTDTHFMQSAPEVSSLRHV